MAVFIPCREEINAEETAALYAKHIFTHYGLPTKLISNRDPCFMSKSPENCARFWESNRTYLWHTTLEQTGSQNTPINGWNHIFASGSMSIKITGQPIYPWQSSHTTTGRTRPQGSLHSSF